MAEKEKKAPPTKEKKPPKPYKKPAKYCPKCGPGTRLAEHKDRRSCGKCGYFERK